VVSVSSAAETHMSEYLREELEHTRAAQSRGGEVVSLNGAPQADGTENSENAEERVA